MSGKQSGFQENIQQLYQIGKNVRGKNLSLSKTCLLGALYGQLVTIGALPPELNSNDSANFSFMDQIVLTLNWHDLLQKVKVDHYTSFDRLMLLSTLNLLGSCYSTINESGSRKNQYQLQYNALMSATEEV